MELNREQAMALLQKYNNICFSSTLRDLIRVINKNYRIMCKSSDKSA